MSQEAREGSRFEIGFRIEPAGEHDYAVRCSVDGVITTSRAMSRTEHDRTSSIEGVPVTYDGSKMQPFRFAATNSSASREAETALTWTEPEKPRKLSLGPSSSPSTSAVGTIRIAMTRCVLDRVPNVSSDQRPSIADASSRADAASASHVTKLGTLAFDTPRRAYRVRAESEQSRVRLQGGCPMRLAASLSPLGCPSLAHAAVGLGHVHLHLRVWLRCCDGF